MLRPAHSKSMRLRMQVRSASRRRQSAANSTPQSEFWLLRGSRSIHLHSTEPAEVFRNCPYGNGLYAGRIPELP
jgi:hypothetical protein